MSEIKLLIKEDGVYVDNPKLEWEFIRQLKEILEAMGSEDIEEAHLLSIIKSAESPIVLITSELPEIHDAGISFTKSIENPAQVIATIITPKGSGKPLTVKDINERLDDEGLSAISVFEKNILDALKRQTSETGKFSFIIGEFPPPVIKVDVTSDEMAAYLTIKKYRDGQKILIEEILKELDNAKVSKGRMMDVIEEIENNNTSVESVQVAKGELPIDGANGEIIYHFDAKKEKKGPLIDSEGKADYHNLNLFENVNKGDLLCQLVPPKEGTIGFKVTGTEIPAKPGRECMMPQGQNTELDPVDSLKLISSIDGCPKLTGGRVIVEPIMNIRGDVGVSTGDVDFIGTVQITGGIIEGYTVKAKGDIVVNGPCESAQIIADGNVMLQKGLRSKENATIKAGGDVYAAFLEGVNVEAKGDVIIRDYCYHSNIKSEKSVQVHGKKGFITGGRVEAKEYILARRIGSQSCPRTEILVDAWINDDGIIDESTKNAGRTNVRKKEAHEKKEIGISKSEHAQPVTEETSENDEEKKNEQYIAIVDTVHPNVLVIIKGAKLVTKEEISGVKFVYKLERIEMISYEHEEKLEK